MAALHGKFLSDAVLAHIPFSDVCENTLRSSARSANFKSNLGSEFSIRRLFPLAPFSEGHYCEAKKATGPSSKPAGPAQGRDGRRSGFVCPALDLVDSSARGSAANPRRKRQAGKHRMAAHAHARRAENQIPLPVA